MKNTVALNYLREQNIIPQESDDLNIFFDNGQIISLTELLQNYSDHAVKVLESRSTEETKYYQMHDGTKITIGANSVDFFERLQAMPFAYLKRLFCFDELMLEKYLESNREENNKKLKELFNSKWVCRVFGDRYRFGDADLNETLFGLRLTKTQIFSRLKSNTIQRAKVLELIDWFEDQDVYITID